MATPDKIILIHPKCPKCGRDLTEGPHGGMSVNVYCSNEQCGYAANVIPMPDNTAEVIDDIHKPPADVIKKMGYDKPINHWRDL